MRAILLSLALLASPAHADDPPVLELGFGFGALTRHDDVDITRTRHILVGTSMRVTKSFDLVLSLEAFGGNYSPDPALEQSVVTLLAGVRYFPYGRIPDEPTHDAENLQSIYLQVLTGPALLTLVPYNELFDSQDPEAVGIVGSAAIGWLPVRVRRLSFAAEVRDDVIYFSNDQGLRQAIALYGWLQIDFR
jgi:hypothetical protein